MVIVSPLIEQRLPVRSGRLRSSVINNSKTVLNRVIKNKGYLTKMTRFIAENSNIEELKVDKKSESHKYKLKRLFTSDFHSILQRYSYRSDFSVIRRILENAREEAYDKWNVSQGSFREFASKVLMYRLYKYFLK